MKIRGHSFHLKKILFFILICVIAILRVFLLGKFVILPALKITIDNFPIITVDPRYDAVFEGTYIYHTPALRPGKSMYFAQRLENGTIHCADYRYSEDVVYEWIETVYVPVSKYTYAQKEQLELTFRERFAIKEALPFCSVQYQMDTDYFIVTCNVSDVDQKENCTRLYEANLLEEDARISMSATQKSLLELGFIKK